MAYRRSTANNYYCCWLHHSSYCPIAYGRPNCEIKNTYKLDKNGGNKTKLKDTELNVEYQWYSKKVKKDDD